MKRLIRILAALALFGGSGIVAAQAYPDRTITLIVPSAAGGPSDGIARLIAQSMSAALKQQVVVENVAGAGGAAGAARVAEADSDGYTLLIHHSALAAGASLHKTLPYDPVRDFEPVGLVNYGPMVLATKKAHPAKDAHDLLARLKADGRKTSIAHAGLGSNSHLCHLLLQHRLGGPLTEVAYRGTGPAMNDLVAGQVDILCDQSTTAVPQVQSKTIKPFAVTSRERLSVLPEVPTMQEIGLDDLEFEVWHGLFAPKGTSHEVVETLNKALQAALDDPTVQARFAEVGTRVFPAHDRSPAAHRERLEREVTGWRHLMAKAGVSPAN